MDLDKIWKELGNASGDQGLQTNAKGLRSMKSAHPLLQVRRHLMMTNIWGIVISLGYILLMIMYPYWQVLAGFTVVLIFNLVFVVQGIILRNRLPRSVDPGHSMLQEMKLHHAALWKWINNQMYAAKFVFPVAAATGFMLGGVSGSGKSLEQLFTKPVFTVSMLVSMVIFALAGLWLARKLFEMSYKKHLDRMEADILWLEQQYVEEE